MLIHPGALPLVPSYAVVSEDAVRAVLRSLTEGQAITTRLDGAFAQLEREQPALEAYLTSELDAIDEPSAQAFAYFLLLTVFMAFRRDFGARLSTVTSQDLALVVDRLVVDSEVRTQAYGADSYSEDRIAIGQPALMHLVRSEMQRGVAGESAAALLQTLLVEIVALTAAVAPLS